MALATIATALVGGGRSARAALPAGSLIQNGSFETPAAASGTFFSSIPGWQPTIQCGAGGIEIQRNAFGPAFDGQQSLELNSNCVDGVSQVVPTTPGVTYTLSFAFAARPGTAASQNQMRVVFDGATVASVGPLLSPGSSMAWVLHQVAVTATGTSTTLTFQGTDPSSGDTVGTELDAVSLVATPQTLTGRAFGLTASATLLGIPLVSVAPTPDTGPISTTASSTTSTPCVASLSGLVGADALCASVTTTAFPGRSTASASVADATVGIAGIPVVTLGAVQSSSTTTCAGSTGSVTIAALTVGGTVVIAHPTAIAPNTAVNVGVVSLVLNEQVPVGGPDRGLTVNAVHLTVNTLGLAQTNVIVASSESDIGNCP
jgi:hypothetical protein